MSGLGNMAGLGAALPDRNGGGKKKGGKKGAKKPDPDEEQESDGENDPDVSSARTSTPTCFEMTTRDSLTSYSN